VRRFLLALLVFLTGCGVQPSGVITGAPTTGVVLYFVRSGALTPVLRPTGHQVFPSGTLTLLAQGPTFAERADGYQSEVPNVPITLTGTTVTLPDVTGLSTVAVEQIACTVPGPVTLVVGGQSQGPVTCPI
jgi:hypothetical protein